MTFSGRKDNQIEGFEIYVRNYREVFHLIKMTQFSGHFPYTMQSKLAILIFIQLFLLYFYGFKYTY